MLTSSRLVCVALILSLLAMSSCSAEPDTSADAGEQNASSPTADIGTGDDAGPGDDTGTDGDTSTDPNDEARPPGLFLSEELLERARARSLADDEPFATSYSIQAGRARASLDRSASPFAMEDITEITFGWCGSASETSLSEATSRLERQSDWIRTLALEFALTGDQEFGEKAREMMLDWSEHHTEVNLYDFNPDFTSASIDGQTDGFCSDRPWNFALDMMWQAYGLINAADAYILLTRNGLDLSAGDDEAIREWILRLTEAVNSSFHAWTKWADHHPNSGSFVRYRSDNHLSWALAGLISAAAALEDTDLANYVLHGGEWTDRRAGAYDNPSYIRDVIARAIEGDEEGERGRLYEEKIRRDPPVGYSLFHLWAIVIVAQVAELHFDDSIWSFHGEGGGSIEDAHARYVDFALGERESPVPEQDGDMTGLSWHFELALHRHEDERFRQAVEQLDRHRFIIQSWGPLSLLFGE